MDNRQPYSHEELKKKTFQSIFGCKNGQAKSLKKPINYINYSREEKDILSKGEKGKPYEAFSSQCMAYQMDKPPAWSQEEEAKRAKKYSLDKKSAKFINRNIKTQASFGKSQRDKVVKAAMNRTRRPQSAVCNNKSG